MPALHVKAVLCAALLSLGLPSHAALTSAKPTALHVDSLTDPLGIDTPRPILSWILQDPSWNAHQTAYQVTVFTHRPTPTAKPDVWDSGRVESAVSAGVPYNGPALKPSTRYFWQVKVWDKDNKPYPVSDAAWWETGLMDGSAWKGQWIGDEPAELHAIRTSGAPWITNATPTPTSPADTHHDFRLHVPLDRPVKQAVLFTTGQDTAAAWVNGTKVLEAAPLSPWLQMPWSTYARQDVTAATHPGDNLIAIEITRYKLPSTKEVPNQTPMSMCLYVVFTDGSTKLITSAASTWKAALDAPAQWPTEAFNDSAWKPVEPYKFPGGGLGTREGQPWPTGPVASLRKTFQSTSPVVSARLYATALGAYKFRLNGTPVGDQVLAPGWMDFREHVPYQVYDVTKQIHPGPNAIAAYLAPGWYTTPLAWFRQGNNYGVTQPALKAQLRLEHADGSVQWIATDATWKADTSPILQAEIYDGETLDARRNQPGWDTPTFNDAAWRPATLVTPKEPRIVAQYFPPIREESTLTAKSIASPKPGVYIVDFGQNMSALPDLHVTGKPGQQITLRFAEILNPDGTLYIDNLRTAKATDRFILAGTKSGEEYKPSFTFHGFRYAEITGLTAPPTKSTLTAVVLHTDAPFTTRFSTGDKMVNQLWSNILWGQRSNFVGVPTDCPQRDERLGWSADAQVFWRTASFNMDLTTFSQKYAADLHGTQTAENPMYGIFAPGLDSASPGFGAAWSDAGVIVPWTGWMQSGNPRIIEENWDGMKSYIDAIDKKNPDHLWRDSFGIPFGDWLTPTITTPEDLLATAYYAYDVTLLRQMAIATNRSADAARYATLFENIKQAFQKAYVRNDGFIGSIDKFPSIPPPTAHPEPGSGDKDHVVETQTGYVLALHMNLLPDNLRAAAAERLIGKIEANHWLLGTGFLGTPYLLEVLSDTGHADVAYRLLLNREYPSWGYLIEHGATTTWERWNGDQMTGDPSMNSYNHYAYGAVAEWMYRYAAGVDTTPTSPGFQTIALHPNFDPRIGHLDFAYDSPYGTIHSAWSLTGQQVTWTVTIPPNTTATLPRAAANATNFTLDKAPLEKSPKLHATTSGTYEIPAGTYTFQATMKPPPTPTTTSAAE